MTEEQALARTAQAWRMESTRGKEPDPSLAEAFATILRGEVHRVEDELAAERGNAAALRARVLDFLDGKLTLLDLSGGLAQYDDAHSESVKRLVVVRDTDAAASTLDGATQSATA